MPDIFDAVAEKPSGDIFDQLTEPTYGEPGGETLTAKEAGTVESESQKAFPPVPQPGFFKELGRGLLSAPKATAGAVFELSHSDEDLKNHLLEQYNAAGREGEPTKAGKVGQFIGSTASSIGEGLVAGATGGPTGIAGAFGAIGAYNAFIKAGTRAIAQGLDLDRALLIAKKAALVNAPVQAAVTFALPGSRAVDWKEALRQGGRSALAGGAGQVVENVTENALGLPTPLLEGVPQAALTMGGLPLASHALAQIPKLLKTQEPFQSTLPPMPAEEVAPVLPPVEQADTGALPPKAREMSFPATDIAEAGLNVTQDQWDRMQDWQRDNVMQEIAARKQAAKEKADAEKARLAEQGKSKEPDPITELASPTIPTSVPIHATTQEQQDFQRASEETDLGAGAAEAVGSGPSQAEIAPPVESTTAKQPWQMTWKEFREDSIRGQPEYVVRNSSNLALDSEMHQEAVRDAIQEGKPVPPEVLADYPDLTKGGDLIEKEKRQEEVAPTATEPTIPSPAAPAEAQAQVTKVAATEGVRSAKAIKEDLIAEIQERLQKAPADLNDVPEDQRTVTIDIPGDGKFTVHNTIEAISELLKRAKKIETKVKPPGVPKAAIKANTKMFEKERAEAEAMRDRTAEAEAAQAKAQGQLPGTRPTLLEFAKSKVSPAIAEKLKSESQVESYRAQYEKEYPEANPPPVPGLQALGIAPGQAAVKAIGEKLSSIRSKLANSWSTRGNKADIARLKDAADNQARILAAQQGKSVLLEARRIFSDQARQALKAVIPVIESGGDRTRLQQFIAQSRTHLDARKAAVFAEANWDRLQPLAAKIKAIHDAQIAQENAHGIATEYRENYIKHAFDVEKLPNRGQEFFGGGGAGARSGFKAARKFETVYDAIEAGYGKALKSLDADKLTQSRLESGQQLINDRQWVNGFRGINDPTTGKPLLDDVTFDRNHFPIAPPGYDAVQVLPGQFIAVHNGYGKIFKAVTGESKIAQGEIAGLPVGELVLNTAAGIKHGLLLFDTFHASRIMQKQFFLTGKRPSWNKGLSLLDYTDADLNEAVRQGEITTDMANYARANRPTAQLLLREGLNVGRIQEALRNEVVRNLPVVGAFNRLVFDKIARGAMMESALIEFERVQANNPGMTPQAVAAMTAKKINVTFGNIGRQGLFKSRTMQDLSRLLALAPQWVESMARSEVGGFKELGQVPVDLALGKGLQVGTLGKTMAGGLLAYVVGTQLLNLATRGQFTWQNKEEGHKLDAWIPDVTGKTPGFFLNPLSVVSELTHDAYRYAFKSDSVIDIAGEILNNKMSPLARSQKIFWSGKNYSGEKIDGTWKRIKESAAALTPAPIPVSGFNSGRPGQAQRQLTASAGIKTEPAPTATKQIADKAARFVADKGRPKEVDLVYHEGSPHNALRNAIGRGDEEAAMQAIATLRKTQTDAKIYQAWRQTLTHPFTGSAAMEAKFRQSLSEDDKQLYDAAKKERQARFTAFQALWAKRKSQ